MNHSREYVINYANGVNTCTVSGLYPLDFRGTPGDTWLVRNGRTKALLSGWHMRNDRVWIEANLTVDDIKLNKDLRSSDDLDTIDLDERFESGSIRVKNLPTSNKKEDNTHMTNNEGMAMKAENSITEEQLFESNKRVLTEVALPVTVASVVRFGIIHLIGRKLFPQVFTGLGRSMAISYLVSMMTGKITLSKQAKDIMAENKFLRDSISR